MTEKVWIACYIDYEEYAFLGVFHKQYDAFMSCLQDYKEYNNMIGGLDRKEPLDKFLIKELIKRLKRYEVYEYNIR